MRNQVKEFAGQMETNLKANDHKGGWETCDNDYLLGRMHEEVEELKGAVLNGASPEIIAKEAADVANFAMMIADNARRNVLP